MVIVSRKVMYDPGLTLFALKEIQKQIDKQDASDYDTEIYFRLKAPFGYNAFAMELLKKTMIRLGYTLHVGSHVVYWKGMESSVGIDLTLHKIWWDDDLPF